MRAVTACGYPELCVGVRINEGELELRIAAVAPRA
jgi:hypothetical protein